MVRAFSATMLLVLLTLPCVTLSGEGHGRYYPQNSALTLQDLRFVLEVTEFINEMIERKSNTLHDNPSAKNQLLERQVQYRADATKVAAEIWRRVSLE